MSKVGRLLLKDCRNTPLSYNPAFVAQGDILDGYTKGGWFNMVLVGAANSDIAERLEKIYRTISGKDQVLNVCIMSPESAEICKLASNWFPDDQDILLQHGGRHCRRDTGC